VCVTPLSVFSLERSVRVERPSAICASPRRPPALASTDARPLSSLPSLVLSRAAGDRELRRRRRFRARLQGGRGGRQRRAGAARNRGVRARLGAAARGGRQPGGIVPGGGDEDGARRDPLGRRMPPRARRPGRAAGRGRRRRARARKRDAARGVHPVRRRRHRARIAARRGRRERQADLQAAPKRLVARHVGLFRRPPVPVAAAGPPRSRSRGPASTRDPRDLGAGGQPGRQRARRGRAHAAFWGPANGQRPGGGRRPARGARRRRQRTRRQRERQRAERHPADRDATKSPEQVPDALRAQARGGGRADVGRRWGPRAHASGDGGHSYSNVDAVRFFARGGGRARGRVQPGQR